MGTAKSYGHKNWKRINKIWKIFVVIKSSKVIQGKRNWVKKVMFKKNWLGLKPPSHMGLQDSQIEMENPPTQHYESSIFFCALLVHFIIQSLYIWKCYISWQFFIYLFIVKTWRFGLLSKPHIRNISFVTNQILTKP